MTTLYQDSDQRRSQVLGPALSLKAKTTGCTEALPEVAILKESDDAVGNGIDVLCRAQESCFPILNDFRRTVEIETDNGFPGCLRLNDGSGQTFPE